MPAQRELVFGCFETRGHAAHDHNINQQQRTSEVSNIVPASGKGSCMGKKGKNAGAGYEHAIDGHLHQGKHGTCVFHALARVINDMMMIKYNIGMDMEFIIHMLESSSVDPRSPVYKTQTEGCSIPAAVAAINDGIHENFFCMMLNRKRVCKFRNKENGDRYCISLKSYAVKFRELNALLGVFSGYCCAVVILRQDRQRSDNRVDHTYHGVAAFARLIDGKIKVKNSWGTYEPTLDVTRENFEEAYVIFPKLERLKTLNGITRRDIPPSQDFHEFKNCFKRIMANENVDKAVYQGSSSSTSTASEDDDRTHHDRRRPPPHQRGRGRNDSVHNSDSDTEQGRKKYYTRQMIKTLADCPLMVATDPMELRVEDKKELLQSFADFLNNGDRTEQNVTNLYFRHFLLKMLTDEQELAERLQIDAERAARAARGSQSSCSEETNRGVISAAEQRAVTKQDRPVAPLSLQPNPLVRGNVSRPVAPPAVMAHAAAPGAQAPSDVQRPPRQRSTSAATIWADDEYDAKPWDGGVWIDNIDDYAPMSSMSD